MEDKIVYNMVLQQLVNYDYGSLDYNCLIRRLSNIDLIICYKFDGDKYEGICNICNNCKNMKVSWCMMYNYLYKDIISVIGGEEENILK